jgi:hypothetical protein
MQFTIIGPLSAGAFATVQTSELEFEADGRFDPRELPARVRELMASSSGQKAFFPRRATVDGLAPGN